MRSSAVKVADQGKRGAEVVLVAVILNLLLLDWFSQSYAAEAFHPCLNLGIKKSVVFIGGLEVPQPNKSDWPEVLRDWVSYHR
jgi:hypothetical protein